MKRKFKIVEGPDGRWAMVREAKFTEYWVSDGGMCRRVDKRTGRKAESKGYHNPWTKYYQIANTLVHRLVAEAFLERPRRATHVHHLNGDRGDNRVQNLMWTTRKANNSTDEARRLKSLNRKALKHDGQMIQARKDGAMKFFKNGYEAARFIGCSHVLVYNCLNGAGSARRAKGWTLCWAELPTGAQEA